MNRVALSLPFLVIALALGRATPTAAQTPPAASEPAPSGAQVAAPAVDLSAARRHFEQAVALYNDGDYNTALAEFQASYQANPLPAVLYNLGLTQKALFRYAEAIDTLRSYLSQAQPRAERRAEVERLLGEMEALLAPVTLVLEPAAATLLLDGRSVTLGVAPLRIAAGGHVLEASADGYRPLRREIMVSAGQPLRLRLALQALPRSGQVSLRSQPPGARVTVDGKDLGAAPLDLELKAGGHLLQLSAPGRQSYQGELVVSAGQHRQLMIPLDLLKKDRFYHKWWFWTLTALAVGGATAGIAIPLSSRTQAPLPGTLDPYTLKVN